MVSKAVKQVMQIFSSTSFLMNLALIPLICLRSGKDIGSYKYLLLAYTVIELIYSFVTAAAVPVFNLSELGWIYYSTTGYFNQLTETLLVYAFSACFAMLSIIITYSFLYRYFVFCKRDLLKWFSKPCRIFLLVVILFGETSLLESELYYFFSPRERTRKILSSYVTDVNLSTAGYMALIIREDDGNISRITIITFALWAIMEIACTSIIVFVIFQMVKSFRTLEVEENMSEQFRKLQRTLFTLLVLQTIVPVVFSVGPVGTSYIWPYLEVKNALVDEIYSIMLPISQFLDPILIVIFIRDYRLTFLHIFHLCRHVSRSNAVQDINMSFMPTKNTETTHAVSLVAGKLLSTELINSQ